MCAHCARAASSIWDASGQLCETPGNCMKKFVPWILSLVLLLWAVSKMVPPKEPPGLNLYGFGRLPVLVGGRVMPMDTLARVSLSEWNHHGTYTSANGKVEQPSQGLLEIL